MFTGSQANDVDSDTLDFDNLPPPDVTMLHDSIANTEETDAENERILKHLTVYGQLKKVCSFAQFIDYNPI